MHRRPDRMRLGILACHEGWSCACLSIPKCPNTTEENVFPMTNSRILERTKSTPPKRIKTPLFLVSRQTRKVWVMGWYYVNAAPPPVAPLHAIKQQDKGVVVNTNAPSPLSSNLSALSIQFRGIMVEVTYSGVGLPKFFVRDV